MAFTALGTVTLDLHGKNVYQAGIALDAALKKAGNGVYRIRVIHGHNSGDALKKLTAGYAAHPRVLRCVLSPDGGQTELVLREL